MNDSGYVLSVSELNEYAGTLIRSDALLRNISLKGEISGFKRHSSGHLYFVLKDESSSVRCVMCRQNAFMCDVDFRDGMSVVLKGYASIYARDGQFQFYASEASRGGDGDLYKEFLKLKAKLLAKGMFDEAHKRSLPRFPKCIGVVTSRTGAVIHDITDVARRRFPGVRILLCSASVQGAGAAAEIVRAIKRLNESGIADVIIVGRGGGSIEDLAPFNDENVANAIYASKLPVVSAVGHETDFTIADFVADMRAPTPSAAAELCVPVFDDIYADVAALRVSLGERVDRALSGKRERLGHICDKLALSSPAKASAEKRRNIEDMRALMKSRTQGYIAALYAALDVKQAKLESCSVKKTLSRGFAIIQNESGEYAASVKALHTGETVKAIMYDGAFSAKIDTIDNGV